MAEKWTKAKLSCDAPKGKIEFDFNPETIKFTRKKKAGTTEKSSASSNSGFPGGSTGLIFAGSEMPTIKLMKIIFDGPETKKKVELLSSWMSPISGDALDAVGAIVSQIAQMAGADISANLASKLPEVTFSWGTGFKYPCNVENISLTYERFAPDGMPTRAKITDITLKWTPKLESLLKQNPTSGGPAGYVSHVMTAGENIPSVAMSRYGQVSYWRALAEANRIDDPMRVRPGQKVFLPTSDELIRAARR